MAVATVIDHSAKVLNRIDQNIKDLLIVSGEIVRSDAKANTPVDLGTLRGSIISEVSKGKAKIGSDMAYAARIELGYNDTDILGRSFNQKGWYMLTNALRNNSDNIVKLFKEKLLK